MNSTSQSNADGKPKRNITILKPYAYKGKIEGAEIFGQRLLGSPLDPSTKLYTFMFGSGKQPITEPIFLATITKYKPYNSLVSYYIELQNEGILLYQRVTWRDIGITNKEEGLKVYKKESAQNAQGLRPSYTTRYELYRELGYLDNNLYRQVIEQISEML